MKAATKLLNFFNDLQGNVDFSNYTLEEMKIAITTINDAYLINWGDLLSENKGNDSNVCLDISTTCLAAVDCDYSDLEFYEFFDLLNTIYAGLGTDEFTLEDLPCGYVRIINDRVINHLWSDSLLEQIKECYEIPDDLPGFFVIDWDQTVENCKIVGLGHHFGSYDGKAYQSRDYNIFRTN